MKRRSVIASLVSGLLGAGVSARDGGAGRAEGPRLRGDSTAGAAGPSPRPVTRGESLQRVETLQHANVDWLNATFSDPGLTPQAVIAHLARIMKRPVTGTETGRGLFGFENQIELQAHVGSRKQHMGSLALGGESQRGRWMLQITGAGCGLINDWQGMREMLDSLGATITRLDLAVDFLQGQYTVSDAEDMYREGGFTSRGRPPSIGYAGDWFHQRARTLYIGNAKNGKLLRAYEKGHQLGDMSSPWTRFEVQFGNRDRVIPMDALVDRDRYFAGAYPVLATLIDQADAQRIETQQADGEVTLGHLLTHLRRTYGKAIDAMSATDGFEIASMVEHVRVSGLPRRVKASSLAAAPTWDRVLSQHLKGT